MQGKIWTFLRMAILLCLMMPAGLSSARQSTATAVPQTFRMLTYNVQFRPSPETQDDKVYNLSDDRRAGLIANRVIAENYDIVALQEVFDDSARNVLTSRLASAGYQGGHKFADSFVVGNDSGLALYTKLPVQLMSIPAGRDADCREKVTTTSGTRCRVAFYRYRDRSGADAFAQKGVAVMRVRTPAGRVVNVFATHMQAGGSAEEVEIRRKQVVEAVRFVAAWSADLNQDRLLLGDFNINAGSAEYADRISAVTGPSSFGSLGLRDGWADFVPSTDPGHSFDGPANNAISTAGRRRIDYMLYRSGNGTTTCFQHMSLQRHYRVEGGDGDAYFNTDLSDHYGVAAVVGPAAPRCHPNAPADATGGGSFSVSDIDRAGMNHWFTVTRPGTYSLSLQSSPAASFAVRAYRATDLSTPLRPYQGSTTLTTPGGDGFSGRQVQAVDSGFLLRVEPTTPDWTGSFTLQIREHTGASFDDAIALDPFNTRLQTQLSGPGVRSTVHYAVIQHPLDSGARQALAFRTFEHSSELRLRVFDANQVLIRDSGYTADSHTETFAPSSSPITEVAQNLFFTVDNLDCRGGCQSTYKVRWETNYRQLNLQEVRVLATASAGSDRVAGFLTVDNLPERRIDLGRIHAGTEPGICGSGGCARRIPRQDAEIGFSTRVSIRFVEQDSGEASSRISLFPPALPADPDTVPTALPLEQRFTLGSGRYFVPTTRLAAIHN